MTVHTIADSITVSTKALGIARTGGARRRKLPMHMVDLYRDQAGEWRWRYTAGNGRILGVSPDGYRDRVDAVESLRIVTGIKVDVPRHYRGRAVLDLTVRLVVRQRSVRARLIP